MKTISERLKFAREELGMSQEELAKLAGVSQGTIGNIESGARKNPRELLAIAEAVKRTPQWLKSGREPLAHDMSDSLIYAGPSRTTARVSVIGTVKMGRGGEFTKTNVRPPGGHVLAHSSDAKAYAIRVSGDELHPFAAHGSCIVVEPGSACVEGENVLITLVDGAMLVRELASQRADSITVLGIIDGRRETYERKEVATMHAIGSVVAASKWRADAE